MTIYRTSKEQLAQILAPLTVLPGADRMEAGHWTAYHAVLGEYFPHELRAVAKRLFCTCEFWPQPKRILEALKRNRQVLGSNALDRVKAVAAGLPDPGPLAELTEADRAAMLEAFPEAKQIGHAKSSES
ncbi:MAG: hypothetical protein JSV81_04005 [Anaerolineales bacterium]|nr:MAG: hypothetical protein JSV81_04005 [Anaerolineales bacterium]